MGLRKFRERIVVQTSVTMRGNEAAPSVRGWLNSAGTLVPTSDGANAGTSLMVNLATQRARVPISATAVGTASAAFASTADTGQISIGQSGATAQIGFRMANGSMVVFEAVSGGSVVMRVNPAGA